MKKCFFQRAYSAGMTCCCRRLALLAQSLRPDALAEHWKPGNKGGLSAALAALADYAP